MRKLIATLLVTSVLVGLGATSTGAATKGVRVADNFFSPSSLTIRKGDRIKFAWRGRNTHNVRGAGVRCPFQKSGSCTRSFRKRGRFTLVCDAHSGMKMRLRVR